jgi:hypothetical protein
MITILIIHDYDLLCMVIPAHADVAVALGVRRPLQVANLRVHKKDYVDQIPRNHSERSPRKA